MKLNGTWDKKKELLFTMNIEHQHSKNIIFVVNGNDYLIVICFLITYLKTENRKILK